MGVIDGSPRSATAVAAEECKLLRINVEQFQALLGRTKSFHAELLVKLVSRFRDAQKAWIGETEMPRQETSAMGPGYAMLARHRDIAEALDRGEIVPFFQPIVDLASGEWHGFEALARWRCPHKGLTLPADFLPLVERTGLIRRIDLAIAERAMTLVGSIGGDHAPYINVNFSAWHFRDKKLLPTIMGLLDRTGLAPHRLRVELTESLMLDDPVAALHIMTDLAGIGVLLALDDFGTGYSSLSVLHRMPIHILKIDRALVNGVLTQDRQRNVLRNVVTLAHDLGMEIIPEGIEDIDTAAAVMALGCHTGQGFLFARPTPAEDAIAAWDRQVGPLIRALSSARYLPHRVKIRTDRTARPLSTWVGRDILPRPGLIGRCSRTN